MEHGLVFELLYACFWLSGLAARPIARFLNIPTAFTFCQLGAFKGAMGRVSVVAERIEQEKRSVPRLLPSLPPTGTKSQSEIENPSISMSY